MAAGNFRVLSNVTTRTRRRNLTEHYFRANLPRYIFPWHIINQLSARPIVSVAFALNRPKPCRHRRAVLTRVVRLSGRKERERGGKKRWQVYIDHRGGSVLVVPPFGFSPPFINRHPATRHRLGTGSFCSISIAPAEEAAEHGGTLLAI